MTEQDIQDVIAAFARAARNAIDVGFDGIALHGGHGYLLDSFCGKAPTSVTTSGAATSSAVPASPSPW